MILQVVGSNSSGNSYILTDRFGNQLLIEAGMRWSIIKQALNFDLSRVVGCLISHEHGDHAKAVKDVMLAGIETYMSAGTALALEVEGHRLHVLFEKEPVEIGPYKVLPFDTQHDAADPIGFLIQHQETGEKLLFATDTFYVKYTFAGLDYIMVECNYIRDILGDNVTKGKLPKAHKDRLIKSHFELENVKQFLLSSDLSRCRSIVLIHLSDGNSDEGRMAQDIYEATGGVRTIAARAGQVINLGFEEF